LPEKIQSEDINAGSGADTSAAPGVELTAPAGSYDALAAAIRAGADSVYFGAGKLNMRSRASADFDEVDIRRIARICRWCGVKSYLALNVTLYQEDIPLMRRSCDAAKAAGVSAVIASDLAVMDYCLEIGMPVHVSVQANVANVQAVKHYARYADVVVLARELSLAQIREISSAIKEEDICGPSGQRVRIEIFAHGALCVAVSGHCYMSLATTNASANRGECLQPCRRSYKVVDDETGDELVVDNHFVMSPRDLCTVQYLDLLLDAGVRVLKLEGRGRPADYVRTVTRVYREALDAYYAGDYNEDRKEEWIRKLGEVFNRGFWHGGFYCGEQMEKWAAAHDSRATKKRFQIGVVSNYFVKPMVAEFILRQPELRIGDELLFEGPTTGALRTEVEELRVDGKASVKAVKDEVVTVAVPARVRRNDKVFVLVDGESL